MLINPCNIAVSPSNTGSECNAALKATAAIILVPRNAVWHDSDLVNFTSYLQTQIHAAASARFYPIFGSAAPVRTITDAKENDVIETLDDGSMSFIRHGMYSRTFLTTEGGLCLAQHLMSFSNLKYSFIEVDIAGQVAFMKNVDGSYSGFPTNLAYGPLPDLANFKTGYKNSFMLSFSPSYYIQKGKVFAVDSTEDILDLVGLLDSEVDKGTQTQSATNIFVAVKTVCGQTDLVALYGTTLAQITNFIVKNSVGGAVVTPSAAAVIGGEIRLTGTYTSGQTYIVSLAPSATLKANGLTGYEGTVSATVPIP